jgi:hypothetical protein
MLAKQLFIIRLDLTQVDLTPTHTDDPALLAELDRGSPGSKFDTPSASHRARLTQRSVLRQRFNDHAGEHEKPSGSFESLLPH